MFAVESFHNSSAQFFKPACCFIFSKLSDSRCRHTSLLFIAWNSFLESV